MNLGQKGVFWFTDALNPAQLIELVQNTEKLGYSAFWYPEVLGYESFALGSFLLGLGVSHVPLVKDARGHQYRQPVSTMRAYLDSLDKAVAICTDSRRTSADSAGCVRSPDDSPSGSAHRRGLSV